MRPRVLHVQVGVKFRHSKHDSKASRSLSLGIMAFGCIQHTIDIGSRLFPAVCHGVGSRLYHTTTIGLFGSTASIQWGKSGSS